MRNAELRDQRRSALLPPVWCYHRIGGPVELGVTRIAGAVFARQMNTLARAGWRTLTLDGFASNVRRGVVASCNEFLLSFDDGYASLADHVYPLLAEVGFTATTFLVTDYVGRLNTWDVPYTWHRLAPPDWDSIGRWQARGFGVASHSASPARLTWLSDAQATVELGGARGTLVRPLGAGAGRAAACPLA